MTTDTDVNKIRQIKTCEPNKALIEHLKAMLVDAEKGELQGIIEVCLWDSSETSQGWCPAPKAYHTVITSRRVVGELEYLKNMVIGDQLWVAQDEADG